MTDSGFSSVASNRTAPSLLRPSQPSSNSFLTPRHVSTMVTSKTAEKAFTPGMSTAGLPKPRAYFQSSGGRPGIPNRVLYNGGYSPGFCSPKEMMSPMSSLAFDFRDLNTSQDADTPRKRLSLSSVSSLDSPLLISHLSPSTLSLASTTSSPCITQDDGKALRGGFKIDSRTAFMHRSSRKQVFQPYRAFNICKSGDRNIITKDINASVEPEAQLADQKVKLVRDVTSVDCMEVIPEEGNNIFRPIKEGCFTETPSPLDHDEMESKFERALQERNDNINESPACGDGKLKSYRRFKSMPGSSKQSQFRLRVRGNEFEGKENSPIFSSKKQTFNQRRCSFDASPSPLSKVFPMASPSPFNAVHRRRPSNLVSSPSKISPMMQYFSPSSSSAFSAVSHPFIGEDAAEQEENSNQEDLYKDAEERLRDVVSPRDRSLTPERSVVPSSIASLSARTTKLPRPASAVSFFHTACRADKLSPIPVRANKRSLDSTNTSLVAASKRPKCSGLSFDSSNFKHCKTAFVSKERKVKSADAALSYSSPHSSSPRSSPLPSFHGGFRPISAPAQMLCFDDDPPLTHSRLCSSNDADADTDDESNMVLSSDRSDADERLLEEMLNENALAQRGGLCDDTDMVNFDAPSGLDGLITAPLLLNASKKTCDSSMMLVSVPKPRELFRSPSAPPVVPSRRALAIKRAELTPDTSTPFGIKRRPPVCSRRHQGHVSSGITSSPTVPDIDEELNTSLNRSRSVNELDIMRAVDLGCSDPNLIGDFSRVCSLTTVNGKHQDLKYIEAETLIELVNNEHNVGFFEIIDCRYPYEYDGGHVVGACSIWEEEKLFKRYFNNPKPMWTKKNKGSYKPPVLVFYCEFSSERGPRMARALRKKDRELNEYPHLHYPEIYILKNGYKNFYNMQGTKAHCQPQSYRPMAHEDFARELRMCRVKSKTWAGEKTKCGYYNRHKRL